MISIYIKEAIKNLKKNVISGLLNIILFILLYSAIGNISGNMLENASYSKIFSSEVYVKNNIMTFRTYTNLRENEELLRNTENHIKLSMEFFEKLDKIKNLKYNLTHRVPLPINDFKGSRIFDFNYQNDMPVDFFGDGDFVEAKCLFTGYNFHHVNNYNIIAGRNLTDEDLIYNPNGNTPVLLGYSYLDIYQPGDILEVNKIYNNGMGSGIFHKKLEVIGIIDKDFTVLDIVAQNNFIMDTYIIIPYQKFPYEELLNESFYTIENTSLWYWTLFARTNLMVTDEHKEQVVADVQKILNEHGRHSKYYVILDLKFMSELYNGMEQAKAGLFLLIIVSLMILSIISVIILVIHNIRRNMRDYSIHRLVGGTTLNVSMCCVFEILLLLLCGDFLGFAAVYFMDLTTWITYITVPFFIIMLIINILTLILTYICSNIFISRGDLSKTYK